MTTDRAAQPDVGIIGRTLRLMLGLLLGWMVFTVLRSERPAFALWVLAVVGGVTVCYLITHPLVHRYGRGLHPWSGAVLALAPVILVFALGGSIGRLAAVAYLGLSYLLQAVRGAGGCEVLAVPAFLLRRRTHLMAILFAPIDVVEKHLTGPGGLPG